MKIYCFRFECGKLVNKDELNVNLIKSFVSLSGKITFEITLNEGVKAKYLYLDDLNTINSGKLFGMDYVVFFSPCSISETDIDKISVYCYGLMNNRLKNESI